MLLKKHADHTSSLRRGSPATPWPGLQRVRQRLRPQARPRGHRKKKKTSARSKISNAFSAQRHPFVVQAPHVPTASPSCRPLRLVASGQRRCHRPPCGAGGGRQRLANNANTGGAGHAYLRAGLAAPRALEVDGPRRVVVEALALCRLRTRPVLQAAYYRLHRQHASASLPTGSDNAAAEASLNTLFSTSWPLSHFLRLAAGWAHRHGVTLQVSHIAGKLNDWADDFSRGRLDRFAHRPEERFRVDPSTLSRQKPSVSLHPGPGAPRIGVRTRSGALIQCRASRTAGRAYRDASTTEGGALDSEHPGKGALACV